MRFTAPNGFAAAQPLVADDLGCLYRVFAVFDLQGLHANALDFAAETFGLRFGMAAVFMLAMIVVAVNFIVDMLYMYLNPQIRIR